MGLHSPMTKNALPSLEEELSLANLTHKPTSTSWRDVGTSIEQMDSLYGASFGHWLKCEENVTMTSNYLYRIANDYPIDRIANALKWLFSGWTLASIAVVVRHVTIDWVDVAKQEAETRDPHRPANMVDVVATAESRRALLIREVTRDWNCSQIAQLLGSLSSFWPSSQHREVFIRNLTKTWDFCRLSEFFSLLPPAITLDYRVKVSMLQDTAKDRRPTPTEKSKAIRNRKRSCSEISELEAANDPKRSRTFPSQRNRSRNTATTPTPTAASMDSSTVPPSPSPTAAALGRPADYPPHPRLHRPAPIADPAAMADRLTAAATATSLCAPRVGSARATPIPRQAMDCTDSPAPFTCPLTLSHPPDGCTPALRPPTDTITIP
ncbi:hypothetical protein H4R33_004372 [Dimargaris cristalligena]|nr:hypothetical protein H4R33_004372 [Dimargaris cristalligena]